MRPKQSKPRLGYRDLQQNLGMLRELEQLAPHRQSNTASSGIYYLFQGDEVVYIGQSMDLTRRLVQHRMNGEIAFDSFAAVKFPAEHLDYYEAMAIRHHAPRFNANRPRLPAERAARKRRVGVPLL